jgi:protein TonB
MRRGTKAAGSRSLGAAVVVAVHLGAAWLLLQPGAGVTRLSPAVITARLVAESRPPPPPPAPTAPRAVKLAPRAPAPFPVPEVLPAAQAPVPASRSDAPPVAPMAEAPSVVPDTGTANSSAASTAAPVVQTEQTLVCHERAAPTYPVHSRRLRETGTVVLEVELDESGRVAAIRVDRSSGHARLDEAAMTAVRRWRCQPPQRNGLPIRGVAVQPIRFVLEGS